MVLPSPSTSSPNALPPGWDQVWEGSSPFLSAELKAIRESLETMADGVSLDDGSEVFGSLVHAAKASVEPVHRWYQYKEAFAPTLPLHLVDKFSSGSDVTVVDMFGGVGTTAVSLAGDPRVSRIVSVEYSPFAHFVATVKARWPLVDTQVVRKEIQGLVAHALDEGASLPELATFHNPRVFDEPTARGLCVLRDRIENRELDPTTRDFLRLGLAAIVEPVSNAIKDGRALRVVGAGHRKRSTIQPRESLPPFGDPVRDAAARQWIAMAEDVEELAASRDGALHKTIVLRGDSRNLMALGQEHADVFGPGRAGLCLASPPYLNCIDYTEVYKLELWLLGFVKSQEEFRQLRLGTLRSHPSLVFPDMPTKTLAATQGSQAMAAVRSIADFLAHHHARPAIAKIVEGYFEDMTQVLSGQLGMLEAGGHNILIVGNSTFSGRLMKDEYWTDSWRLPILTDVLLARLALELGYVSAHIIFARDLRPRNVHAGSARESLLILRKSEQIEAAARSGRMPR